MTQTILSWGDLSNCLLLANELAAHDTVPAGTMNIEKQGVPGAEIIRMVITIDLVPHRHEIRDKEIPF